MKRRKEKKMLWLPIKNVMGLFSLSLVVLGFTLVIPAQEGGSSVELGRRPS